MASDTTDGSHDGDTAGDRRFTVAARRIAGAAVLSLTGELDHDTVEPLRTALTEQIAAAPARIVVDCTGLRFCDSTGLNVLLRARSAAAQTAGADIELAALQPPVARMFEITGADAVFRIHTDLDEALAGRPPG
ncbi:metal ABC transporter substrate-binding protein [Streptomyces sp. ERV7]|uniref:STAS domain-containing protein n=1 Tax=Streptomyces sp. ERV7 TaxID=1322334 RepID=UPI0007F3CD53|nr:STAS domain-containing protein [Streptomyces sp. ERV7]OAR26862.1 metal ABC transporter substrate-binding protein [Streptomyces sp. ERV7]